jgi:hypothetical protein
VSIDALAMTPPIYADIIKRFCARVEES